ncbi:MAG: alpha/beta fold hydrolase [Pirellulales bacterium]
MDVPTVNPPSSPARAAALRSRRDSAAKTHPHDPWAWKSFADDFPRFRPARWIGGAHAQTLGGVFLPYPRPTYRATRHQVVLDDGDRLILHDDCPKGWRHGRRTVLMIHGLTGSHRSGYMERTAAKLNARGIRTFRMDLRGCGAGAGLARFPYHSGRSDDAAAALREIARLCPDGPTTLVGFSLGGNIALKLLGELENRPCGGLDSGIAVCPPVDLSRCANGIGRFPNSIYNRHFVKSLLKHVGKVTRHFQADAPMPKLPRTPKGIVEFDDLYTAPLGGFVDGETYYRECSGLRFLHAVGRPTLIMAAENDPMIPPFGLRGRASVGVGRFALRPRRRTPGLHRPTRHRSRSALDGLAFGRLDYTLGRIRRPLRRAA